MDKIIINDLEVSYSVGVPDEERSKPQRLLITVELERDFTAAAAGDDITKTIDYNAVCQRLLHFGEYRRWKLLETMAVEIAQLMLEEFKAGRVVVEIKKFIIPETRWIAVRIERSPVAPVPA